MDEICHQKGVEHALDHMCDSLNSVASGIAQWLHDGWGHSCPTGHRHRCSTDPSHSRTKTIVAIWTLAGEGGGICKGGGQHVQKDFSESYNTKVQGYR